MNLQQILTFVHTIFGLIEKCGGQIFGGFVRDLLLKVPGKAIKDIDIHFQRKEDGQQFIATMCDRYKAGIKVDCERSTYGTGLEVQKCVLTLNGSTLELDIVYPHTRCIINIGSFQDGNKYLGENLSGDFLLNPRYDFTVNTLAIQTISQKRSGEFDIQFCPAWGSGVSVETVQDHITKKTTHVVLDSNNQFIEGADDGEYQHLACITIPEETKFTHEHNGKECRCLGRRYKPSEHRIEWCHEKKNWIVPTVGCRCFDQKDPKVRQILRESHEHLSSFPDQPFRFFWSNTVSQKNFRYRVQKIEERGFTVVGKDVCSNPHCALAKPEVVAKYKKAVELVEQHKILVAEQYAPVVVPWVEPEGFHNMLDPRDLNRGRYTQSHGNHAKTTKQKARTGQAKTSLKWDKIELMKWSMGEFVV